MVSTTRRSRPALIALVIVGAALGAVTAVVGWVAGSGEPDITTLVVAGVLGAVAGVAAGIAAGGLSKRSRRRAATPAG